jgi:predicted GH43/DUF377 family glycosyl hydrolase
MRHRVTLLIGAFTILGLWTCSVSAVGDEPLEAVRKWLIPQMWERDTDGPVLSLGESGEFDDTHIFAPTVARDGDRFRLWYSGSTGFAHDLAPTRTRDERVFRLGLAESADGIGFQRHNGPVLELPEARRSIVTASILRDSRGRVIREDGKLRLWFTSATLGGGGAPHAIQQALSTDGIQWSDVSEIQLSRAYCPSVVKSDNGYQMWYTEPGRYPWLIRHATSADGSSWTVTESPVLKISQAWEHDLQIYPCVLLIDGVYLMWYASYLAADHETTAIGFAASTDGIHWFKHPNNPVLKSDPKRPWESHYVSSHSVMQLDDGSFRIWYSSRKAPPFQNLYFAINTAVWNGPQKSSGEK